MERDAGKPDVYNTSFTYQTKQELTPLSIEDEKQIILDVREGKLDGVGTLVEHYGRDVYKHVFYMIRNVDLANDLVGEVFMRTINAIGKYEHRGSSVKHWLVRIGHNLALDHIRRKSNKPTTAFDDHVGHPNLTVCFEEKVVNDLDRNNDVQNVVELMDNLKPEQAEIIRMRFMDEMSYEDVAEKVGKSTAAIRVIQHRALKKLRQMHETSQILSDESVA